VLPCYIWFTCPSYKCLWFFCKKNCEPISQDGHFGPFVLKPIRWLTLSKAMFLDTHPPPFPYSKWNQVHINLHQSTRRTRGWWSGSRLRIIRPKILTLLCAMWNNAWWLQLALLWTRAVKQGPGSDRGIALQRGIRDSSQRGVRPLSTGASGTPALAVSIIFNGMYSNSLPNNNRGAPKCHR
jgi:hypothetical protein